MERTGKKNASENSIAVRRKKTRRKLKKKNEMKKKNKQNWRLSSWCHLCRSITSAEEGEGEQLGDAGVNHAPIGNLISAPRLGHRLIYSGLFYYLFFYFFFFWVFARDIGSVVIYQLTSVLINMHVTIIGG